MARERKGDAVICARCDRPLTKAAVSIETRNGQLSWGPVCARYVVVKPTRTQHKVVEARRPAKVVAADPRQFNLFEVFA